MENLSVSAALETFFDLPQPLGGVGTRSPCEFFDTRPKEERRLMFGREKEFTDVERDLRSGFWPVLLGPKRVGKTSIMKVIVKENAGIYVDASTSVTAANLGTRLIDEVESGRVKVGVKLDFVVIKAELSRQPIRTLEGFLKKIGEKIVAIDEAQNLNDPMLPRLFSVVYNEAKVKMMFSGSEKGLLKRFSGSQMLGRPVQNEEIRPFDSDTARGFLQAGFDSCRVSYEEREVEDAVSAFAGIAGWLSYYGAKRADGMNHKKAISQVREAAREVVQKELSKLGPLEAAIVKGIAVAEHDVGWDEAKSLTKAHNKGKDPDNKSFSRSLKALADLRIVGKDGDRYFLLDPLYKLSRAERE